MNDPSIPNLHQLGHERGHGNLLGIAPYMTQYDYISKETFHKKLGFYLAAAQRDGWLNEKTIAIFPEYIGTWLIVAGEAEKIFHAPSLEAAERALVLHHPLKFLANWFASKEKGRAEAAFFRMKANQMAEIYHDTFSRLAQEYGITIVAGSIVLPAPQLLNRYLLPSEGPLYNTSLVYQPDGTPHPQLIRKIFPTTRELPFTTPASANDLPSFDTPAGRLGVLICADSWYPQAYLPLKEQGINILAVPSYDSLGMRKWYQPWPGYDGWQVPADVDVHDIKNITEGEAWGKYALAGRMQSSGATYGINVFPRGKLWDLDLGGWCATMVRDHEIFVEEQTQQAALLNVWL